MEWNGRRCKCTVIRVCHQRELGKACASPHLSLGTNSKKGIPPSNLFPVIKTPVWKTEVSQVSLVFGEGWGTHFRGVECIPDPPVQRLHQVSNVKSNIFVISWIHIWSTEQPQLFSPLQLEVWECHFVLGPFHFLKLKHSQIPFGTIYYFFLCFTLLDEHSVDLFVKTAVVHWPLYSLATGRMCWQ